MNRFVRDKFENKPQNSFQENAAPSGASRRDFLKSVAAVGAVGVSAMLPAAKSAAQAPSTGAAIKNGRIDVHNHITPPALIKAMGLEALGGFGKWTPEKALEDMDAGGVTLGVASIPPHYDPKVVDALAHDCNEYAARLAQDHPGRFGVFAMLPLPHIDVTLKEIAYVFDALKVNGVGMYTNYGDKWLGDPYFNPVFEELNRRKAVVFTHPITADCCKNLIPGVGDGAIEWQTDTTRAITYLIFGGAQDRYPDVKMIFSHGGGTMPFLTERFVGMARNPKVASKFPQGFAGAAAKFYYDTAQVANPPSMAALSKVVPLSQIVFGTDYNARGIAEQAKGLMECGAFSPDDLKKIFRENTLSFLPGLKT